MQIDDPQTHQGRLLALVRSYLLPQGFPDSVAPQYATYMAWRGVQYFFGGAMSVFTTKCLLTSLGVAGRHSVSSVHSTPRCPRCPRCRGSLLIATAAWQLQVHLW